MRVGIIQPNYIPWRGYFDFIDDVDIFIFYDDVEYSKGDWRNRNRIKTPRGTEWITVPVKYNCSKQLICETSIDSLKKWNSKHAKMLQANYGKAAFFELYIKEFIDLLEGRYRSISELNTTVCKWIMGILNIGTQVKMSYELSPVGNKTERLIDILKKVHATTYLSGPVAQEYLEHNLFISNGIHLEYKSYDYLPYPQMWGDFIGEVTVLDLLFNVGPDARHYLKSQTPNKTVL